MILIPYKHTALSQKFSVLANFDTPSELIYDLSFKITGPTDLIKWPEAKALPTRQIGLWNNTCFEAFFSKGNQKSDPYIEMNCTPSGDWNTFYFSSYRENRGEAEASVKISQPSFHSDHAIFQISVLNPSPLETLFLGITLVLEFTTGEKSYWALNHTEPQPDFHAKEAWKRLPTR